MSQLTEKVTFRSEIENDIVIDAILKGLNNSIANKVITREFFLSTIIF